MTKQFCDRCGNETAHVNFVKLSISARRPRIYVPEDVRKLDLCDKCFAELEIETQIPESCDEQKTTAEQFYDLIKAIAQDCINEQA